MSLKMTPSYYNLNFSSYISRRLNEFGALYCSLEISERALRLIFSKSRLGVRYESTLLSNRHSPSHTASVHSQSIVTTIGEFMDLGKGLHYINIEPLFFGDTQFKFEIGDVVRSLQYDNQDDQPKQPNTNIQQPTLPFSIATFSDKDLFDELKRRGYEGKLCKTTKIELQ